MVTQFTGNLLVIFHLIPLSSQNQAFYEIILLTHLFACILFVFSLTLEYQFEE